MGSKVAFPQIDALMSCNQSVDVLRGVAILLVLGRHAPYVSIRSI
jgi:peptidoglycan/LPS O-acetylase OafA/YrhL